MAKRAIQEGGALEWQEVDTDNLSKKMAPLFKAYRSAQDAANEARKKFDEELEKALRANDSVPAQMFCLIAHKWGRVSFAISEEERTRRGGSGKSKVSV